MPWTSLVVVARKFVKISALKKSNSKKSISVAMETKDGTRNALKGLIFETRSSGDKLL